MGCGSSSEAPKAAAAPEKAPDAAPKTDAPADAPPAAAAAASDDKKKEESSGGGEVSEKTALKDDMDDRRQSVISSNIDARLTELIRTLQDIPRNQPPSTDDAIEGYLDMQIESGHWEEKLECVFKAGVLEVNRVNPPLNHRYTVAFCEGNVAGGKDIKSSTDELYYSHLEAQGVVHAIKLFTQAGTHMFRAQTKEVSDTFSAGILKWCEAAFGKQMFDRKSAALEEFNPLMQQQFMWQIDRYNKLQQILKVHGVTDSDDSPLNSANKDKSGILLMERLQDDKKWKEFYFVLFEGCFYYYESSKSTAPSGIISLKCASVELDLVNIQEKEEYSFKVSTPLRTVVCKTKHEVALAEWIVGLEKSLDTHLQKGGVASRTANEVLEEIRRLTGKVVSERVVPEIDPAMFQSLTVNIPDVKKPMVFDLPKTKDGSVNSITIGRDPSSDLVIDDKKISRAHCKVEYTDTYCMFIDMGSNAGCKLNGGERIIKAKIKEGDTIKIGSSTIEFNLKAKGKYAK